MERVATDPRETRRSAAQAVDQENNITTNEYFTRSLAKNFFSTSTRLQSLAQGGFEAQFCWNHVQRSVPLAVYQRRGLGQGQELTFVPQLEGPKHSIHICPYRLRSNSPRPHYWSHDARIPQPSYNAPEWRRSRNLRTPCGLGG